MMISADDACRGSIAAVHCRWSTRANCKTIFLNWPTSGEHDFSSLFRDIGGNLIGYGGGIMANLI
ncbi:hypothetical protein, partial [Massilia genomosp. 1]|uniref:hypothetical protein n=1 Tax=Massilia genomosp. 1 TaxID=2609280 RepID=UPI001C9E3362